MSATISNESNYSVVKNTFIEGYSDQVHEPIKKKNPAVAQHNKAAQLRREIENRRAHSKRARKKRK